MKKSLKILAIVVAIMAIAVPLARYQPVKATDIEDDDTVQTIVVKPRCKVGLKFLKRSEPTEIEGKASSLVKHMLLLDIDGEQVRVLLPPKWTTMDGEVMDLEVLFDNIEGQIIIVGALQIVYENPQGVTISIIFGYEINNDEYSFYAVLPFNIDT